MMSPSRVFFTIFNMNVHLIQNQEFGRWSWNWNWNAAGNCIWAPLNDLSFFLPLIILESRTIKILKNSTLLP